MNNLLLTEHGWHEGPEHPLISLLHSCCGNFKPSGKYKRYSLWGMCCHASKSQYLDLPTTQWWQGLRQVQRRAIILTSSLPDSHRVCWFFWMTGYKEDGCTEYLLPANVQRWVLKWDFGRTTYRTVSRELIRHSSLFVDSNPPRFSQKWKKKSKPLQNPSIRTTWQKGSIQLSQ